MKFSLKSYQLDAVLDVLSNLGKAARRWREEGDLNAFSLSATTGAGKTVMAAAVFEALFFGDDTFDFEADRSAVVLWFSDDPSLNEQTRFRLLEASDRLTFTDLVVVGNTFNQEMFDPGKIYFLNTQKLGRNSLLTRGFEPVAGNGPRLPGVMPDGRSFTIWDTIRNTIENPERTLYLVLDEAHRGMGSSSKAVSDMRSTIVKRLINGGGVVPPVPVVWGISATVDRFRVAMGQAEGRSTLPDVVVDPIAVQESGLLKDTVVLDIPGESGVFDTVLLRRGTRKLREVSEAWEQYSREQNVKPVIPLMVLQIPNKPDPEEVGQALTAMFDEWPHLNVGHVAHVLGEHTTQTFGPYQVNYVSPERVQDSKWVRVLIAKDAISTGWDCPRAEVMVSFRPARDRTNITQLLGRMVRSPLARRIPGNERLNAVDCLLPFFDSATVTQVAKTIMSGADTNNSTDEVPPIQRVLINPVEVIRNPEVPGLVWDKFLSLPSETIPKRVAHPIKRLTRLAHELAYDSLLENAGKIAHREMHKVLDAARTRYSTEVVEARKNVLSVQGRSLRADLQTKEASFDQFVTAADQHAIDAVFRRTARMLSPDLAKTYVETLAAANPTGSYNTIDALIDARATVAALGLVPEIKNYLETEATKLTEGWLTKYRIRIKTLNDERQNLYRDLRELSTQTQTVELAEPKSWIVPTTIWEGNTETPLPTYLKHLLADPNTKRFPTDLNSWETDVLNNELQQPNLVGWYRNPNRYSQDALAITYTQNQTPRSLHPDFIVFTQQPNGTIAASIIDPHSHHLGDSLPKLKGLANYAKTHGHHYQRIDAIAKIGDTYRVLDLTEPATQTAIDTATDTTAVYQSRAAQQYLINETG